MCAAVCTYVVQFCEFCFILDSLPTDSWPEKIGWLSKTRGVMLVMVLVVAVAIELTFKYFMMVHRVTSVMVCAEIGG